VGLVGSRVVDDHLDIIRRPGPSLDAIQQLVHRARFDHVHLRIP
jgi:hypothetical protein